jgi:large subunit ribosomal protein L10
MAHVSEEKKKIVAEFKKLSEDYPIIAAVNMEGLPTPQLQAMRAQLRSRSIVLKMTKKRILKVALETSGKKDLDKMVPFLVGHPALLFTKENPFKLFKSLEKNKSSAPAKGGQIAPKDIIVPAGPTGFAPGPIIGELGQIGIKAGIDAGKVIIKVDSVVVKEGQVIKPNVAAILTRLKIEPMEIGLDLVAAYENGEIFTKQLLRIDEKEYIQNITKAHTWAFNLAVDAGVYNKTTIEYMVTKADKNAKAVAISENILAKEVVGEILAKAERQGNALKILAAN